MTNEGIQRVERWRVPGGKLFETRNEAIEHEMRDALVAVLTQRSGYSRDTAEALRDFAATHRTTFREWYEILDTMGQASPPLLSPGE
jgi:hypothetical protein